MNLLHPKSSWLRWPSAADSNLPHKCAAGRAILRRGLLITLAQVTRCFEGLRNPAAHAPPSGS